MEMTQEGEDSDPYDFTEEENSRSTDWVSLSQLALLGANTDFCLFVLLNVKAVQHS